MKKLKILSLCLASVVILVFAGLAIGGEKNTKTISDTSYDFPIKPGTDAWKKFVNHDEMFAAVQIPVDVLKNMSTRALVETCLNYPLRGDMMAYNSKQQGLEAILGFNGLQELFKREDAGVELLAQYRRVNGEVVQEIKDIDSKKIDAIHYFDHSFIEMLLAQNVIRSNMSEADEKFLVRESLNNFRLKEKRPDIYSFSSLESETLVMKKVLEKRGLGLQLNVGQASTSDEEASLISNVDQIVSQSEDFISK